MSRVTEPTIPGRRATAAEMSPWGRDNEGASYAEPWLAETTVVSTGTPDPHWLQGVFEIDALVPQTFGPVVHQLSQDVALGGIPQIQRGRSADLDLLAEIRRGIVIQGAATPPVVTVGDAQNVPAVIGAEELSDEIRQVRLTSPMTQVLVGVLYDSQDGNLVLARYPMVVSTSDATARPSIQGTGMQGSVVTLPDAGGLEGEAVTAHVIDLARAAASITIPVTYVARMVRMAVGWREWLRSRRLA